MESQANLISIPSAIGGLVTVSACRECPSQALRLANDFRPMVDGKTATLDQLRARLSGLGSTPIGISAAFRTISSRVFRVRDFKVPAQEESPCVPSPDTSPSPAPH
ncbi:MAG: hypothetical protein QM736_22630 [Vicinamibacterales bacterium]